MAGTVFPRNHESHSSKCKSCRCNAPIGAVGWSGSEAALPPPRPLRTGLETFTSSGSSRSNAPFTGRAAPGSLPGATSRYTTEDDTRSAESSGLRRLAPAIRQMFPSASAPYSTNSCFGVPVSFLVTSDQTEVCPLSRGIMYPFGDSHGIASRFNPYPTYYRLAFAFSVIPYPPPHRLASRLTFPEGGRRAYHVPLVCPRGLGPSSTPGVHRLR